MDKKKKQKYPEIDSEIFDLKNLDALQLKYQDILHRRNVRYNIIVSTIISITVIAYYLKNLLKPSVDLISSGIRHRLGENNASEVEIINKTSYLELVIYFIFTLLCVIFLYIIYTKKIKKELFEFSKSLEAIRYKIENPIEWEKDNIIDAQKQIDENTKREV